MFVTLRPIGERTLQRRRSDRPAARASSPGIPGGTLFLQSVQDLRIGGRSSSSQYQFTLAGRQPGRTECTGARSPAGRDATLPGVVDVNSDQQNRGLQASLTIDRDDRQPRWAFRSKTIDDTLYDAFGQRQVSTMYTPLNQYHVVMEVEPEFCQNPDGLQAYLRPRTATTPRVPLERVLQATSQPPRRLQVNHSGQFPSITISFNLTPGFVAGRRGRADRRRTRTRWACPNTFTAASRERPRPSRLRCAISRC